jgi:hypothetical protein
MNELMNNYSTITIIAVHIVLGQRIRKNIRHKIYKTIVPFTHQLIYLYRRDFFHDADQLRSSGGAGNAFSVEGTSAAETRCVEEATLEAPHHVERFFATKHSPGPPNDKDKVWSMLHENVSQTNATKT